MWAGCLLVSHPVHCVGPFARTVVVVTEHSDHGTVGLCVNRPHTITQNEILAQKGIDQPFEDQPVYTGGPVNSSALILLHSDEWYSSNTQHIVDGLSMSSDTLMMEKIAMHNTPQQQRWIAGVSAWRAGQLAEEVSGTGPWQGRPQWLTIDYSPDLVFGTAGDTQWRRALELCAANAVSQYF